MTKHYRQSTGREQKILMEEKFSIPVQTGAGANPASYKMGTGFISWG